MRRRRRRSSIDAGVDRGAPEGDERTWTVGHGVALAAITLVAAVVRAVGIDAESLWYDEAISLEEARRPLGQTLAGLRDDGHPPLYPLLLRGWVALFGPSPAALRSLSALLGTLAIPVLAAVAFRWKGARAALLAAAIAALSRVLVHHSQDARDYALLFLFGTASFLALDRALEQPSVRRLAGWVLATAAALWASPYGPFVWVTQALLLGLAAFRRRRSPVPWRRWLAANAAVLALFAPWAVVLVGVGARKSGSGLWISPPTGSEVLEALVSFGGTRRGVVLLGSLAVVGLASLAIGAARDPRRAAVATGWLVGPFALPWVVSWFLFPVFLARGTIVAAGAFLALAGCGLASLWPRRVAFVVAAAATALVLGRGIEREATRMQNEDWRGAARHLAIEAQAGDALLLPNRVEAAALRAYDALSHVDVRFFGPDGVRDALAPPTPRVWLLISSHSRRAEAMPRALASAGYVRETTMAFPPLRLERWRR